MSADIQSITSGVEGIAVVAGGILDRAKLAISRLRLTAARPTSWENHTDAESRWTSPCLYPDLIHCRDR